MTKLTLSVPARCVKALLALVPLPPLPSLFSGEGGTRSTNAKSIPIMLAHAVCRALKSCTSLDRPLPAGCASGKDGIGNSGNKEGDAGGGGQELDHTLDQDGPPPPPPGGSAAAMRVAGE